MAGSNGKYRTSFRTGLESQSWARAESDTRKEVGLSVPVDQLDRTGFCSNSLPLVLGFFSQKNHLQSKFLVEGSK